MNKLFETHWETTKAALLEGRDIRVDMDGTTTDNKLKVLEALLENQRKEIMKRFFEPTASVDNTNFATMNKVLLPIIRYSSPSVIANELVGVQVLSDRTGTITTNQNEEVEITARNRRMSARWTFEVAGTSKPVLNEKGEQIDIEAEIMAALAQETKAEFDQELIHHLRTIANHGIVERATSPQSLADLISIVANRIKTKLGKTNDDGRYWCVVSVDSLKDLEESGLFEKKENERWSQFKGFLNKTIRVYSDPFARVGTPILVGYKGSETDAASVFAPYLMIDSGGVTIDPHTFEPVVSFKTEYGYYVNDNATEYLGLVGAIAEAPTNRL